MTSKRSMTEAEERGIVLYMVLVVILLLLAAGALLAAHLQKRMAIFRDQERNLHVQALIDTGMAEAMAVMKQDFRYQGIRTVSLDGGSVTVEVRYTGTSGIRSVALTSRYRGESRRATADVWVEENEPPVVQIWRPVAAWEED